MCLWSKQFRPPLQISIFLPTPAVFSFFIRKLNGTDEIAHRHHDARSGRSRIRRRERVSSTMQCLRDEPLPAAVRNVGGAQLPARAATDMHAAAHEARAARWGCLGVYAPTRRSMAQKARVLKAAAGAHAQQHAPAWHPTTHPNPPPCDAHYPAGRRCRSRPRRAA